MRFVLLAIVLAFPLLDLYVTARFARWTRRAGVGLARGVVHRRACVCCATSASRSAPNTVAALHGEQSLLRGLLDSGRKVLAGMLFIAAGRPVAT